MLEGKRGQFSIFGFMVTAFFCVVFFAGLIYSWGLITGAMQSVGQMNEAHVGELGYVNISQAVDITFGSVNATIGNLRMVALVYILAYASILILTSLLSRMHPIWFIINLLTTLLAVIYAPIISNAYASLMQTNIFNGLLTTFSLPNTIIAHLPSVVLVIGTFMGILSFINLIRGINGEGGMPQ